MMEFLNKDFNLLDNRKDRLLFILICLVFSILFVNVFVPFNINRWGSDSGIIEFIRLSSYGIIVAIVFLFTQFPLRKWFKVQSFKVKSYILWILIEIFLISLVYIMLYGNPLGNFVNDFIFSIKYTMLGILLPYTFSITFIHFKNQRLRINTLKAEIKKPANTRLISFKDENEKVKFSVLVNDVLFLESTDNYITVHYLVNGKAQKKLVRNTFKNYEDKLNSKFLIRCHRSYMINIDNIEFVEKENKTLRLKIKCYGEFIPVSRTYIPVIVKLIAQ